MLVVLSLVLLYLVLLESELLGFAGSEKSDGRRCTYTTRWHLLLLSTEESLVLLLSEL